MTAWRLVLREIGYRKANFLLGALAALVAAACVVAAVSLLQRYDRRTEQRAAAQEAALHERTAALEDDYRKITKGLGFNVLILPKDQNLANFYAEDFAAKLMPESYAQRLVRAKVASINHIMPVLQQKVKWPERERTVQLIGTRGEIGVHDPRRQAAILDAPAPGRVIVGHELHRSLKLAVGDKIVFRGLPLTVSRLMPERGNQDDIALWVDLAEAQKLLDRQGRINAILALECNCAADRLANIRGEIAAVLPDTQVVEFSGQALARAEARNRAAAEARQAVAQEKESRAAQRQERERLFALLAPLVIGACAVWAALLALGNVRSRVVEIGVLRALGVPSRRVLAVFLLRAALIGLLGAGFGFTAGYLAAWLGEQAIAGGPPLGPRFDWLLLALVLLLTPLLSVVASWLPALWAAQIDRAQPAREHVRRPMLECRALVKQYPAAGGAAPVAALDNVSLQLARGEFVVVEGPSGSGKSTLLLTLGGLLAPTGGSVIFEGRDIYKDLSPGRRAEWRARRVGFVFQQFHLIPYLSALDNVLAPTLALPLPGARERAMELLARFRLADRRAHVPAAMSAGEQQRTALARALLHQPQLLLCDEPTGNLDGENAQAALDCLVEFHRQGGTVLLVTHHAGAAAAAQRVLKLERGRLVDLPATDRVG